MNEEKRATLRDTARALPSIAKLLARLVRDPRIDRRRRMAALGALAYAAIPIDLIPDRIPVIGKIDDVFVMILAVRVLLDGAEDDLLAEHWDGPPEVLAVFDDMVGWAVGVVPKRLRWAFGRLVER